MVVKPGMGPGVIAGIDCKIVFVQHEGPLFLVSPVDVLSVHSADKHIADDDLPYSREECLH